MEIGSIYEIDPNTFSDAAAYDASVFTLKEIKKYNKIHTAFIMLTNSWKQKRKTFLYK